jgi:y4mF family transcriptional regulator
MQKETISTCESMGKTIRDLRRSQGLTQAQLAGLSNTGVRFISDLENGKETCHLGKILHVLDTLGVEIIIQSPYDKE